MTAQTDRLTALTALAKRAWPGREYAEVLTCNDVDAMLDMGGPDMQIVIYCHDRALDAMEAALHVLADVGDDTPGEAAIRECVRHEFERAEAAESQLARIKTWRDLHARALNNRGLLNELDAIFDSRTLVFAAQEPSSEPGVAEAGLQLQRDIAHDLLGGCEKQRIEDGWPAAAAAEASLQRLRSAVESLATQWERDEDDCTVGAGTDHVRSGDQCAEELRKLLEAT